MRTLLAFTLVTLAACAAQAETLPLRSDVKRAPVYPPTATTAPAIPAATAATPAAAATPATPVIPTAAPAAVTPQAAPLPQAAAPQAASAGPSAGIAGLLPRVSPTPMTVLSTTPAVVAPTVPAPATAAPVPPAPAADAAPAAVEVGYDPKVKRDPRGKALIQNSTGTGSMKKNGMPMGHNDSHSVTRHASATPLKSYDEKALLQRSHVKTGHATAYHTRGGNSNIRAHSGGMRWSA